MTPDQTFLEAELHNLKATALDEALLLRLDAAAEGTLTQLSAEEIRFETQLRATSPAGLTADFLAKLEAIVHEVPFAMNEKIVLFPKAGGSAQVRRQRPFWAAAAAVALIGAASALLVPTGKPPADVAGRTSPASPSVVHNATGSFLPASFNRGLSEIHDEGVVWQSDKQARSVVRVVYQDKITLVDENGRTFQVVQPRVEYMLVPAKTD